MYRVLGSQGEELANADGEMIQRWILEGRILPDTQIVDPIYGHARPALQIPELEESFRKRTEWIQTQALQPPAPLTPPQVRPHQHPRQASAPHQHMVRPKNKATAFLLCLFLGFLGLHQFYLGNTAWGGGHLMATLVVGPMTCFASYAVQAVLLLVEGILILTGTIKDSNGMPLV